MFYIKIIEDSEDLKKKKYAQYTVTISLKR